MSSDNARKFIVRGMGDAALRASLNCADTAEELHQALGEAGLRFSPAEFEQAFNNQLIQCQFEEQADQLKEFRTWWDALRRILGDCSDRSCAPGTQCAPGGCSGCGG
jgi:hypothetical protein